jgi:ribosomal protein S18 acetylase RimI-like enzyme
VVTAAAAIRACEERDLDRFDTLGSPQHVQYCRRDFARGELVAILVAVDDDDIPVGKVHLDFETKASEDVAVLGAAAVAPSLQGRGIGTRLMAAAEELARERGVGTIELGAEDHNPRARMLYERLGYEVVGLRDFVYLGAPVPNPGVVMRKAIT